MTKCLRMFYNVFRVFLFTLIPLWVGVVGVPQGSIMFHGLIHPETWYNTQFNIGIAIHEMIIATKTLEQVKVGGRVNTSPTHS
jgi:hypothetical protein